MKAEYTENIRIIFHYIRLGYVQISFLHSCREEAFFQVHVTPFLHFPLLPPPQKKEMALLLLD